MKYRKLPVVIEAWKCSDLIRDAGTNWKGLPKCVADGYEKGFFIFCPGQIHVRTLEGLITAQPDDMIIQGVKGEFYPCRLDIFEATYEVAE